MAYALTVGELRSSWGGRPAATSIHETYEEAEAELADYVRRNWRSEVGDDIDMPDDDEEMIEEYFENVQEQYMIGLITNRKADAPTLAKEGIRSPGE